MRKFYKTSCFAAALFAGTSDLALAQESPQQPTEEPFSLNGALSIPGVMPRLDATGIIQTSVAGDGGDGTDLTGRADLYTDVSSDGMGLWKGTLLRTHLEWRASENGAASLGGALLPTNSAAFLPITGEGLELTSLYIVQRIGTKTNLIVGKVNAVDLLDSDPFFGGMGTKRFQNIVFVAPPSGVVPPTFMGAVLTHQIGSVGVTAMVFDPKDRTGDYWVDGLFGTGVNSSLGATWGGDLGGRPASIGLTATYSSARGRDFSDILVPSDVPPSTKKGSYNIALQFEHLLVASPIDETKGLGVYAKAAVADGNPNIIQSSFIAGLAGHSLFANRSRDSFGIGGFFYNFSDVLQDTVAPIVNFGDEAGLEVWYSLSLTPNTNVVFDAQVIDPASGDFGTAVSLGARLLFSM